MRVLYCIDALRPGGKERQLVELIKGLVRRGDVECRVVCVDREGKLYIDLLKDLGVPVTTGLRQARWDITAFYALYSLVRKYRPDVIHTYDWMSSFYVLPLAKLMGLPLINGSIRNSFPAKGLRSRFQQVLLNAADYRVANSYAGLESRGLSEQDARSLVIHNGFDFSRLDPVKRPPARGDEKERTPASARPPENRKKVIGMVARFAPTKDQATLIAAAKKLSSRRNDVEFVLVGDGKRLEACRQMAGGVESIRFLGQRQDVEQIVSGFDVGVLSTRHHEGISNAIMEYMALGKPVIATDAGGNRELVRDGETGFIVPPGDARAITAKIEYLLTYPNTAVRMGEAGEARLRSEFSLAGMVDKTFQVYQSALADSRYQREEAAHSPDSKAKSLEG